MSALALATDPSTFGWPPGLPIELALGGKPSEVCASYGYAKSDWDRLKIDPKFQAALDQAILEVQKDGFSFRAKAKVQAEELLKTSWSLIHDNSGETPSNVKADLIKWTMRVAGYDASIDQRAAAATAQAVGNALQIVINLGDK